MPKAYNVKALPAFFFRRTAEMYSDLLSSDPDGDTSSQSDADKQEGTSSSGDSALKKPQISLQRMALIFCFSILISIVVISAIVASKDSLWQTSLGLPLASTTEPFTHPPPAMANLKPKNCGSDPTTARARGCHFDIMSMIWMPHECYDADLTAEFIQLNDWEWSRHENGTEPIVEEEIRKGEVSHGWVRFEYHLMHCLYTWKKLNRQVERGGGPIDGYISNSTHTNHCSRMLGLREIPKKSWNTPFIVLYPTCYV